MKNNTQLQKRIEKLVERAEVIINRHSPMENFEIKEQCAGEIVEDFLEFYAWETEGRLDKLETRIFGMPKCSLCGRNSKFQSGTTRTGRIASWCSEKCQKNYKKGSEELRTGIHHPSKQ